jgi:hypothetical protein
MSPIVIAALGCALTFLAGAWLGRRRGAQRAANEAILREAAVERMGAYFAQVKLHQQEIEALKADLDAARASKQRWVITPMSPGANMPKPGETLSLLWSVEQPDGTVKPYLTVVRGPDPVQLHDEASP